MAKEKKTDKKNGNGGNGSKAKGFMAKMSDEQKQAFESRVKEVGVDMDTFQKLLEFAGDYAPVLYTAILKLIEIFSGKEPVQRTYGHHDDCPEELRSAVCDAEMSALETLAKAMMVRHLCCCEHHEDDWDREFDL
jgi:hypothetical protein